MIRLALILTLGFALGMPAYAADSFEDSVFRAKVIEVRSEGERVVPATGITTSFQNLTVELLDEPRRGQIVEVENTTATTLRVGDDFFLHRTSAEDGSDLFAVGEPDRRDVLVLLVIGFILTTLLVAGKAGLRSLLALCVSFALIVFALVPALSAGWPPVPTAVGLALLMLVLSMLITHGVNRSMFVALAGSVAALLVAAVIAEAAVAAAMLSGFVSDEAVYLNFATRGVLDLSGLLLAGILVGVVGVLNDVSVSQAHTVEELHKANPNLSRKELFVRSMKVGQEHLGAVVNTLPLAYAGASLPLLMIFGASEAPFAFIVNREIFAAELIRTLAGGIGLSLSGAVATILAVVLLPKARSQQAH